MMYSNKLAIAIKVDGKTLREQGETVYVPFGSQYTIFIKNLNSVRCVVSISIDGKSIADGDDFVVNPNSTIEIERFIKNNNLQAGNRFKFIERTARVEAHRGGAQVEDGLIRIEYEFEQERAPIRQPGYDYTNGLLWPRYVPAPSIPYYQQPWSAVGMASNGSYEEKTSGGPISPQANAEYQTARAAERAAMRSASPQPRGIVDNGEHSRGSAERGVPISASGARTKGWVPSINCSASSNYSLGAAPEPEPFNDAGITAPGSISEQKFTTVSMGALDGVKHVMVVKMVGELGEVKVSKPITVKHQPRCTSCGHVNKAQANFCIKCGTGLVLV